jgi:serine beta-lactamase-like protein LACTB
MKKTRYFLAAGMVAMVSLAAVRAPAPQTTAASSPAVKAHRYLSEVRASTKTPAVSGAVALGGKMVFSDGAGLIDLENQVPATGASVYNIGSVSKVITAIAVMQLMERKRVDLDDDIRKYVPEFPDKGVKITIRHLLTHTSGIRHYRDKDFPGTPDDENMQPIKRWQDGLRFFAQDPLLFPPGKYYSYSSYAVNLLQGVVEKASGQPFEEYLRQHVWGPAGMASASFDIPDRIVPHRAHSYRIVKGRTFNEYYADLRYKFASGGMIASAEDLVKLGVALNHDLLLRPETKGLMLSPQLHGIQELREGKLEALDFEQGLLWRLRHDPQGRLVAYHCGAVKTYNVCVVDFLKEDLVAAVATNNSSECCGWAKADTLAAFFRKNGSK